MIQYQEISNLAAEIHLPASKSISNRALIIQALSQEPITLSNLSEAEDTKVLSAALRQKSLKKNVGMAGTAARFLSAYLSTQKHSTFLTGDERMKERPMKVLLDALQSLGAEIQYLNKEGYLPVQINGSQTKGGEIEIDASVSSQFITALMLIAPRLAGGLKIELLGTISSAPYIRMTQSLLDYFGVSLNFKENIIDIPEQAFQAKELNIENDWSSASYFYSTLALLDEGQLTLKNLTFDSWQGDEICADIYYRLGIVSSKIGDDIRLEKSDNVIDYLEYDFVDCPDLAQSVICTCVGLGIEGTFSGLHTLRGKETDRIQALQNELKKLKWLLEETNQGIYTLSRLTSTDSLNLQIETYNDHRMAMAFAPLTLVYDQLEIQNPDVVKKSFPNFWEELKKVGIQ